MADREKSGWEKAEIVLKPVGGLLTALAVAFLGVWGSAALDRRQAIDTNSRLYAELMSRREEADSSLRKDMFKSIIDIFLTPKSGGLAPQPGGLEQEVLALELLAYNFHESLDLAPLFKHVYGHINLRDSVQSNYLKRLEKLAREVTDKQAAVLEEGGGKLEGDIQFDDIEQALSRDEGEVKVIDGRLPVHPEAASDLPAGLRKRDFRVYVLYVDRKTKEIRVRLEVKTPGAAEANPVNPTDVDEVVTPPFWIGFFDFPMIDNTRLSHGQRCAIVLRNFYSSTAHISLLYFPGSRAGLKEKPYYEEVIHLLRTRESSGEHKPK